MGEEDYTPEQREQMRREERSYRRWRAGVILFVAVIALAAAWAIANAGAMRTYWIWSVGIAGLIVLAFLTQGFGWVNYGIIYALMFLGCAAVVAVLIQLPPRPLCCHRHLPCDANRYDSDRLRSPVWKENRYPACMPEQRLR